MYQSLTKSHGIREVTSMAAKTRLTLDRTAGLQQVVDGASEPSPAPRRSGDVHRHHMAGIGWKDTAKISGIEWEYNYNNNDDNDNDDDDNNDDNNNDNNNSNNNNRNKSNNNK